MMNTDDKLGPKLRQAMLKMHVKPPDKLDILLLDAIDRTVQAALRYPNMSDKRRWYIAYTRLCNYRLDRTIKRSGDHGRANTR